MATLRRSSSKLFQRCVVEPTRHRCSLADHRGSHLPSLDLSPERPVSPSCQLPKDSSGLGWEIAQDNLASDQEAPRPNTTQDLRGRPADSILQPAQLPVWLHPVFQPLASGLPCIPQHERSAMLCRAQSVQLVHRIATPSITAATTAPPALPFRFTRRPFSAAKVTGSEVKVGNIIERKGRMFQVIKAQHTQQGRGGATIQAELRDVQTGAKLTERLRTAESIEVVFVDSKPFSFLYAEDSEVVLMDPSTYEQLAVPLAFFGEGASLLKEGMEVQVKYFNGEALMAQLPRRVTVKVVEAEPHVKGNTATPSMKKVTLEGGLQVQVPPFVVTGDDVVVDTEEMKYITRA